MPLTFFFGCIFIFLVLSLLSYQHISSTYKKRIGDVEKRYRALEKSYDKCALDLEESRRQVASAQQDLAECKIKLRERETLFRLLLPSRVLTPLDAIRMKKYASDADIASAKEYLIKTGLVMDIEDVLVERKKLTKEQLADIKKLVIRYNDRRRSTHQEEEQAPS